MTIKLVVAVLSTPGDALTIGCLFSDLLACVLLQGALFGTRITYGGYGRK